MKTIAGFVFALASAAAVQVGFAPAATSYIYRSDNGGPGNLVQLGGHGYEQPQLFAPLPLAQPIKALEAYDLVPAPLPYIAAKPIAVLDAEDDEGSDEESAESQKIRPSDDTIEQIESLKERILATDNLRPKSLAAEQDPELSFRIGLGMLSPLPIDVDDELLKNIDSQKAFACSQLQCSRQETSTPVCACNYKSGNVVTFKNDCDAKKHNCRFNTGRTHPNISLTNLKWS
ncbi:hypothetical protein RR46_01436 [Papilio xuthus]|uniref:Kazal-like domain-containing protein n=1 Tax=Papilio xuthus TaxID=66420 RepID=A0A0N1I4S9_PAPXU|nr:hypothetical protein RR46_01436 [Papilio xuthus]